MGFRYPFTLADFLRKSRFAAFLMRGEGHRPLVTTAFEIDSRWRLLIAMSRYLHREPPKRRPVLREGVEPLPRRTRADLKCCLLRLSATRLRLVPL